MTPRDWDLIKERFDELEALSPAGRRDFLSRLRLDEPNLWEELENLLIHAGHESGLLDSPAIGLIHSTFRSDRSVSPAGNQDEAPGIEGETLFRQSERFRIIRKLGSGGMGTVYEVFDNFLSSRVAAKTLRRANRLGISLFKQEFRSLANIHHPNLVSLYEFFTEGDLWFYTMELIPGAGLIDYIARATDAPPARISLIRRTLSQLCDGIAAIHAAGKLHRDIKPGNILVTESGRVVLLDFGLISDATLNEEPLVPMAGSVPWMSPEQFQERTLTTASDWYSLGVVLYEMLAGRLPPSAPVRLRKATPDRLQPPSCFGSVPEDLESLCMDLLGLEPGDRPSEHAILQRLGTFAESRRTTKPKQFPSNRPLFGREQEERALADAFHAVEAGNGTVVCITGQPGAGKTALVRHFLDGLCNDATVAVLTGRCYQREHVPFNALDTLVDNLSGYLKGLPPPQLDPLVPRDIASLCHVFPVLGWLNPPGTPAQPPGDQLQLQRRAFLTFRELFGRLAHHCHLVLFIDDLHWGDTDSATLLGELLRLPAAPSLLLILAFREDGREHNNCLRVLLDESSGTLLNHRIHLQVPSLPADAAMTMAKSLLPREFQDSGEWSRTIAEESRGNPFFIEELAAYAAGLDPSDDKPFGARGLSLSSLIADRARRLPEPARRLLEVVAISGQPVRNLDALESARLDENGLTWLALLRSNHFIRAATPASYEYLEPFHDRVRESILARIPADRRREGHASLAAALERSGLAEPETLAVHFEGAGESRKAGLHFETAARKAARALAFDRAAGLFSRALALAEYELPVRRSITRELAGSLANAGRAYEAAEAYQAASEEPTHEGTLSLTRSGYHYAASGHIDQGKRAFAQALRLLGVRMPLRSAFALPLLLWIRALTRLSRVPSTSLMPADPLALARVDACWLIGAGLGLVELMTGALFTSYTLRLALQTGDAFRIARSLSWEAALQTSQSRRGKIEAERLFSVCRTMVDNLAEPYATAMLSLTEGQASFSCGRWNDALTKFDRAQRLFVGECSGVSFELATLEGFRLQTLVYMGQYETLRECSGELLENARGNRDRYLETFIAGAILPLLHLCDDRPDLARESWSRAIAGWASSGYHLQHALIVQVKIATELYSGDYEAAKKIMRREWPLMRSSHLLLYQNLRAKLLEARARCALAAEKRLSEPERITGRLAAEEEPYMAGSVLSFRAALARRRGRGREAEELLSQSASSFDFWEMRDHAASARLILNRWHGLPPADALNWFTAQKIVNPDRWVQMRLPNAGS